MANTYPEPQTWDTPAMAEKFLARVAELAATAGVDLGAALPAGREAIERARRYKRELRERTTDRSAATRRIARLLAAGDVDLDGAAAQALTAEANAPGSLLARAVRQAEDLAIKQATSAVGSELDGEAVLRQAREVAADVLARIRELRPVLDGIADAEQATTAGRKTAEAWAKYHAELLPRWGAVHDLVKDLRAVHWIDPLPTELVQFARYGRPDLAREDRRAGKARGVPVRGLLDVCCDAWEPGGPHTEGEAAEFARTLDEARVTRAERDRQRVERLGLIP